ncbi:hypothetical protein B9Z55_025006 [Caenorhabditis nigoni]|uniref:Uncharacterized protein n=1 Tax=Caenorhabditis nigoni TaxID=1611254 RepID=A0A2G5SX05_9PELO|nr:hypothetical protein B9Z55_025006 [Caenorhabditis nigoni]
MCSLFPTNVEVRMPTTTEALHIPITIHKPNLDFEARQVSVFKEVIENFEVKCCDEHDMERQKIVEKAKRALQSMQNLWAVDEAEEIRKLREFAQSKGLTFEDVAKLKTNINYHKCSYQLAMWCQKLSQIQQNYQASHSERLLTMKMPPGSHEISQLHFQINYRLAIMAYVVISNVPNARFRRMNPFQVICGAQLLIRARVLPEPASYHLMAMFIEGSVRDANSLLLNQPV